MLNVKNKSKHVVPSDTSDEKLMEQWYEGKEEAFMVLYRKYYKKALLFALSYAKDKNVAKDITQETFLKIIVKVQSEEGKRIKKFRPYLFSSLYRNFIDSVRKNHKTDYAKINEKEKIHVDESDVLDFENNEYLDWILQRYLNQRQKDVHIEKINGYNNEEIAIKLNKSATQIRGIGHRARVKLSKSRKSIEKIIFSMCK